MENFERNGKVQRDPSKIQQWWDQTKRHNDVCTKCGEKVDIVATMVNSIIVEGGHYLCSDLACPIPLKLNLGGIM
jgi:hypothetical protein